jgi:sortase A
VFSRAALPLPATMNHESRIPSTRPRHEWLAWIERMLLCLGAATATWCATAWLEMEYTQRLAIPLSSAARRLPGDPGSPSPTGTSGRLKVEIGTVVARLDAPAVKLSTAVLEGSDDAILNRGAGHIEDTALPGESGNIGIAGHRDTIFRPVRRLRIGDELTLSTSDRVYRYRISRTLIVGPDDVYVLDPTSQPMLTLVTCYPFDFIGHAPKRFIVQATIVGAEGQEGQEGQEGKDG